MKHSESPQIENASNRLRQLADDHLRLEKTRSRLRRERREIDAELVRQLATLLRCRDAVCEGATSLVEFATEVLGIGPGVVRRRLAAARAACKRPEVIDLIRSGQITLSAVVAIEPYIGAIGLLEEACNKTQRQVDVLLERHLSSASRDDVDELEPIALSPGTLRHEAIVGAEAMPNSSEDSSRVAERALEVEDVVAESGDDEAASLGPSLCTVCRSAAVVLERHANTIEIRMRVNASRHDRDWIRIGPRLDLDTVADRTGPPGRSGPGSTPDRNL